MVIVHQQYHVLHMLHSNFSETFPLSFSHTCIVQRHTREARCKSYTTRKSCQYLNYSTNSFHPITPKTIGLLMNIQKGEQIPFLLHKRKFNEKCGYQNIHSTMQKWKRFQTLQSFVGGKIAQFINNAASWTYLIEYIGDSTRDLILMPQCKTYRTSA